jgi:glycosyltransferase involved in cell wall biosynthesis
MSRSSPTPDVIFCDVVPHVIPLAKRLTGRPVLYFCHYPDLLLTAEGSRTSFAYRVYRRCLDVLEERGLMMADLIVANSRFTLQTLKTTFPMLRPDAMTVLYPGVAVPAATLPWPVDGRENVILSVSRFDRRKNLALAIEAIAAMRSLVPAEVFATVKLVFAGAYERSHPEEVSLVAELQQRARTTRIEQHVEFVFSPTEKERLALLFTHRWQNTSDMCPSRRWRLAGRLWP